MVRACLCRDPLLDSLEIFLGNAVNRCRLAFLTLPNSNSSLGDQLWLVLSLQLPAGGEVRMRALAVLLVLFGLVVIARADEKSIDIGESCINAVGGGLYQFNFSGKFTDPSTWLGVKYQLSLELKGKVLTVTSNWNKFRSTTNASLDFAAQRITSKNSDTTVLLYDCKSPHSRSACEDQLENILENFKQAYQSETNQEQNTILNCLRSSVINFRQKLMPR